MSGGGGYARRLGSGVVIRSTRPGDAPALEALQVLVFPTLDDSERFKAEHYRKHIEIFADGQFVAVEGEGDSDRVVGMTSTIRMAFDFDHAHHTFADVIRGGWLTSHDPEGSWLYGADIGTHPDYRRRGIARGLYRARHDTVRRLGLDGQVTVGMLRGYGALKDEMTAEAYYQSVLRGDRTDPTITTQMRIGFEPRVLVPGYLNDPVCDDYGVLLALPRDEEVEST